MTPEIARAVVALRRAHPWTEHLDEPRWAVLVTLVRAHGEDWLQRHPDFVESVYRGAWDRAASELLDILAAEAKEQTEKLAAQLRDGEWAAA